jgi:thymidylate kinase
MAFILLEGLDRSGKSTVAEHYKKLGYHIIHLSAPDKKYFKPGYNGESYLEEMVQLYTKHDGGNILFDRSVYGELIWPSVYSRQAMLSEEDLDYLASIERNNKVERILMYDTNTEAHWQRCIDNKEPLTRQQFGRANIFYERLAKDYGFVKKQLSDFPGFEHIKSGRNDRTTANNILSSEENLHKSYGDIDATSSSEATAAMGEDIDVHNVKANPNIVGSIEDKLERANAIKVLLQGQILKKKGGSYDDLESTLRGFLQCELDKLFTPARGKESLTDEEVGILKLYVKRIKEKMG